MPTYVTLARWTDQGIRTVKESPARLDAGRQAFERMRATIKQFYLVTGRYDFIIVFEAPDDETAVKLALATCSLGNIRTETLRAFTEEEYRKIIAALP